MGLKELYQPIREELAAVEKILVDSIQDTDNPKAAQIADLVLASPGKRLRPALCLFTGKALMKSHPLNDPTLDEKLIKIAASFELIHTASLVHDDVIDKSDIRHNKPTVNSVWGNDASVAFGDFLYSISSQLTTECRNLKLHACMSEATREMCEGELLQVCERENFNLSHKSYLTIIEKKTAGLFASACEAGAVVYNASPELQQNAKEFGKLLGVAFQIIDDYLDIVGEEKKLGKNPGQDIEIGKITLPLLYLLEDASLEEKQKIKGLLAEADNPRAFDMIKQSLLNSNAVPRTVETISNYMNDAGKKIISFPDSAYKTGLQNLITYITERALSYSASKN